MYKVDPGTLCRGTACVFIYFLPFTYEIVRQSLDSNLTGHLKSKAGNHCLRTGNSYDE